MKSVIRALLANIVVGVLLVVMVAQARAKDFKITCSGSSCLEVSSMTQDPYGNGEDNLFLVELSNSCRKNLRCTLPYTYRFYRGGDGRRGWVSGQGETLLEVWAGQSTVREFYLPTGVYKWGTLTVTFGQAECGG